MEVLPTSDMVGISPHERFQCSRALAFIQQTCLLQASNLYDRIGLHCIYLERPLRSPKCPERQKGHVRLIRMQMRGKKIISDHIACDGEIERQAELPRSVL